MTIICWRGDEKAERLISLQVAAGAIMYLQFLVNYSTREKLPVQKDKISHAPTFMFPAD